MPRRITRHPIVGWPKFDITTLSDIVLIRDQDILDTLVI
jgi:hypothetical protein